MKTWQKIAIGTIAVGTALSAPIIPVEMIWLVSYETIAFETSDGDLGLDEYAIADNGTWYIREIPENEGQFTSTTTQPVGKKLVHIRAQKSIDNPNCAGCAYYSEFVGREGKKVKTKYDGRYKDLIEIKDAPQPKKSEFVSILSPDESTAAIAFDATSNSGAKTDVSSFSWSHTNTGSNLLLFVGVTMIDATDADRTITVLTYNSVSLSTIREDDNDTNDVSTGIRYLVAPVSGANTVAVTLNGTNSSAAGGAVSLTGVDQSSPLDANNGATYTNDSSPSTSITTVADNSWVIDTASGSPFQNAAFCTADTGQTSRWKFNIGGTPAGMSMGSTEGAVTPAGATSLGWNSCGASDDWAHSLASFAPAGEEEPIESSSPLWFIH